MDRDTFEKIMGKDLPLETNKDCEIFLGLQIMRKYDPTAGIEGANHDEVYSVDVEDLLDAPITEEDAIQLNKLGWIIHETDCMYHFV